MEQKSSVTAYLTSAFTAFFSTVTLQDVGLYVGIICTVGTFAVNWYYKNRDIKRKERLYGRG